MVRDLEHFHDLQVVRLRSKRFRLVSEQRKTEERNSRVLAAREMKREPALLLAPFFVQSLTLVSRSLLLNRTETLAT